MLIASVLVLASALSSLRVHPHYTSYFNSMSGGPENGWRLLSFSNIDWGQDLGAVKKWIDSHPECRPISFEMDYFGTNGDFSTFRDPFRHTYLKMGQLNRYECQSPRPSIGL